MRRTFALPLPVLLVPATFASIGMAGACSSSDNGAADASIDGFGVIVGGGDGGAGDGGEGGGQSLQTTMRLAHASPDLGPVDFCFRPHGTQAFTGPWLSAGASPLDASTEEAAPSGIEGGIESGADGGIDGSADDASDATADAGAPDGDAAGPAAPWALVFGAMTAAVQLPTSGTFDLALVPAGQASCYPSRLGGQVTLDANKSATAVIMGLAGDDAGPQRLAILPFTDDPIDPQSARVRIIHAAVGSRTDPGAPALSVRAGSTVLAAEVDPMKAATASTVPAVDALGYATVEPIEAPQSLVLAAVGDAVAFTTWHTQAIPDLHVQVGTQHTGILVSLDQGQLGMAWCGDANATSVTPSCTLLVATH